MQKTFLEMLFKPAWKWWVSMPLEILGLLTFINPDWGRSLNLPSLSKIIPWYVFVILGLIILLLATTSEAARRIHEKESQQNQPSTTITQRSGRDSLSAGGNIDYHAAPEVVPPDIFVGITSKQDSVSFETFTLRLKPLPEKPDIEKILANERTRLLNKTKASEIETDSARITFHFDDPSYVDRVVDYLEEYKKYELEKYYMKILEDRWCTLNIVVDSKSILSASNVVVQLYFPDFIHFPSAEIIWLRESYRDSNGKYRPSPPNDPPIIKIPSFLESFPWENFGSLSLANYMPHMDIERSGEYRIMKAEKANIVEYRIKDLLQNHPYTNLDPLDIWLENIEQPISFKLPVEINARELPEKTKRVIEVNITIEGENEEDT